MTSMLPPALEPLRLAEQRPGVDRFWVRHAPRAWPLPDLPLLDLARGSAWEAAARVELAWEGPLDDVLYLPPVAPENQAARDRLAALHLARGTPVLAQLLPGEEPPPGALAVYDLLPALLAGDLAPLAELPAGCAAAWPLIAGLTDEPELWAEGCRLLARAGAAVAQATAPSLSPALRRRLVEGRGEKAFHALFHRPPPPERAFARLAHRCGLAPFLPRPLPRPPLTGAANRRLAGELILAAELWLILERPVGRGLALARAARWIDDSPYAVEALVREGNLAVVPEVDAATRRLVEERLEAGRPTLLEELLAEYLEGEWGDD